MIELEPRVQKMVDSNISGLDIMHGELKVMMLDAEEQLTLAQEQEARTEEAIDSMERTYWEGYTEALSAAYGLTYTLSFAIMDKNNKETE
jgi:hypothetical protein